MAARDGFYSRFVVLAKILLPLASLALLSTLFLFSDSRGPSGDLPIALNDLQERARDEVISNPRFAGASPSGDILAFEADTAQPDPVVPHMALARALRAQINLNSGTKVTFSAISGTLNTRDQVAQLTGEVLIYSSTGYTVRTDALTTQMDTVAASTDGPVQADGPAGQLTAGKMELTQDTQTGDVHLLFTNGVKLVYQP
ncbi:LPS export ABC transporter periplasmic protein LptC [Thalassovita mediterranea]|jgi:lipopolysaccharide export system protein LptC|uniref:Organic solvent tolerance protein OstA n=1 Tax=Thalassovita mediterranea TaxID=340021 RepID=A0A0N7M1V0_9RHOB|nr:LPS export ABC transporter periplasmic protein LptC [Thalassovita mediterranea]MCG7572625.1 LPS export ABC transporter periplasmic protein LptC [Phaeobacter sp. CNT1-3]CUH84323.1 Organic solvent tolerance protein OstA [Thalassovita mediterranea]SIS31860.1 lipopolysaccharide export system protein LptC [Thalassovita mediterranea]